MKLDVFDYLEKPFDLSALKAIIQEAFRVAAAEKRLGSDLRLLPKGEISLRLPQGAPATNEWLIKRLQVLSEKGTSPSRPAAKADDRPLSQEAKLRQLFVHEALEQLSHSEKAIRNLGEGVDVQWELGYLNRAMGFLKKAAELIDHKETVALVEAIRQTVAIYRIRTSLMQHRDVKVLRHAHKILILLIKSLAEEKAPTPTDMGLGRAVADSLAALQASWHK